ncbi:hypothetical protein HYT57_05040 [Candidatus Woesearchaeota archaeon]|nr:hypothetical protein [Candidatus Woesearchaeota archaeon]
MGLENLDEIVLAFVYIEFLGYAAKGLLYSFWKNGKTDIIITDETVDELKTPMTYNFMRLLYRDLTSRITEKDLDGLSELDKQVL